MYVSLHTDYIQGKRNLAYPALFSSSFRRWSVVCVDENVRHQRMPESRASLNSVYRTIRIGRPILWNQGDTTQAPDVRSVDPMATQIRTGGRAVALSPTHTRICLSYLSASFVSLTYSCVLCVLVGALHNTKNASYFCAFFCSAIATS